MGACPEPRTSQSSHDPETSRGYADGRPCLPGDYVDRRIRGAFRRWPGTNYCAQFTQRVASGTASSRARLMSSPQLSHAP